MAVHGLHARDQIGILSPNDSIMASDRCWITQSVGSEKGAIDAMQLAVSLQQLSGISPPQASHVLIAMLRKVSQETVADPGTRALRSGGMSDPCPCIKVTDFVDNLTVTGILGDARAKAPQERCGYPPLAVWMYHVPDF